MVVKYSLKINRLLILSLSAILICGAEIAPSIASEMDSEEPKRTQFFQSAMSRWNKATPDQVDFFILRAKFLIYDTELLLAKQDYPAQYLRADDGYKEAIRKLLGIWNMPEEFEALPDPQSQLDADTAQLIAFVVGQVRRVEEPRASR